MHIPADKRVPRSLIYSCPHFRREMMGLEVPRGIYTHICGIDLVSAIQRRASFWCWKTTCVRRAAFPTCWRIG